MLPEGGQCAFKEGHYAYFLPNIGEDEPFVPFFRNIDHARAYADAQGGKKRARSTHATKGSAVTTPSPAAKRCRGGKEPVGNGGEAVAEAGNLEYSFLQQYLEEKPSLSHPGIKIYSTI